MRQEITVGTDSYWYSHFTGTVKGVRRWTESTVRGRGNSIGGAYGGTGGGGGSMSISTTHTEYCEFFLADGATEQRYRVSGFYKAFLDGHRLTVLWMGRSGNDAGDVLYVQNHSTGEDEFDSARADALLSYPIPFVASMFLTALTGGWLFFGGAACIGLGIGTFYVTHSPFLAVVLSGGIFIGVPWAFIVWRKRRRGDRRAALRMALDKSVGGAIVA